MTASAQMPEEEREVLAAEYALGSLDRDAHALAGELAARDSAFAARVEDWAERLRPMADGLEDIAPPPSIRERVLGALDGAAPISLAAARARRTSATNPWWRGAAIGFGAMAAGLALVLFLQRPAAPPPRYVALLEGPGFEGGFLASVDTEQGSIRMLAFDGTNLPTDRAWELWLIEGQTQPRSLGLVKAGPSLARARAAAPAGAVLAISLEPPGGSPTGAPTGPVVFTGRLRPIER